VSKVTGQDKQLYCALISIAGDTLLVPNSAVTEAIGQSFLTPQDGAPRWLAGTLEWNRRTLIAIHFEALNGGAPMPLPRRARLVILQTVDVNGTETPLALVAQGYPHLVTVTRDAIVSLPLRLSDDPALVLARVRIGSSEALIPDLEELSERMKRS